jgi:hypothetical protein
MHVETWACQEKARQEKTRTQKGTKTRKRELNNALYFAHPEKTSETLDKPAPIS